MARKKKRSAKQLANDRRLGRMAKARAKKKRGGRRKKVARKNPCGTNPHRRATRKGRIQTAIGKAKRKVSAKSHLWIVFKCTGKTVSFLLIGPDLKPRWSTDRSKGIRFKTRSWAAGVARSASKRRGMSIYNIGVAPDSMTSAQIAAECTGGKV